LVIGRGVALMLAAAFCWDQPVDPQTGRMRWMALDDASEVGTTELCPYSETFSSHENLSLTHAFGRVH